MFESPPPIVHEFHTGDMVHVFEGTGVGNVKTRHVAWFGRVVGREGDLYLVRNRVLAAKGRPSLVDGKFMQKQTDFGLGCGTDEKRVHFRNLTKRTREKILHSADKRNNWSVQAAHKELTKVKKQKTQQKDAYLARREKVETQGASLANQCRTELEQQVAYWQGKCETLKEKISFAHEDFKRTRHKQEVLSCVFLYSSVFSCLISCLVLSSVELCFDVINYCFCFPYYTGRKLKTAHCSCYNIKGSFCQERGEPIILTRSAKPWQNKFASSPFALCPSPFSLLLCFYVIKYCIWLHYNTGKKLTIAYCSYCNIKGILCQERGEPINFNEECEALAKNNFRLPPSPFALPPCPFPLRSYPGALPPTPFPLPPYPLTLNPY